MAIPDDFVQKLKQSADIVDIIGSYVPLKRAGTSYKGLSPFKKEKTPSFMVSPSRQTFHDYSSGEGGDIIKFVMLVEGMDFISAVRKVAEKAGIPVPEVDRGGARVDRKSAESLLSLQGRLASHWRDILLEDPGAEAARKYLEKRNIPLQWAQNYCIGYAPEAWDASQVWAKKEGFTQEQLFECGLIIQNDRGRVYDRFRGRLMFPISNASGRVVGFSGRIIVDDPQAPKYINSPETDLYKKSHLLFGLDRARRAILEQETAIICEGQIDVLRCHDSGVGHVVAPLGTALTDTQLGILRKLAKKIILCLDGDGAGVRSAMRLAPNLINPGEGFGAFVQSELGVSIVILPEGQDPDSFIRDKGAEAFQKLVSEARDYIEFYIEHQKVTLGFKTASEQTRVIQSVAELIRLAPNGVIRSKLISEAAMQLEMGSALLEQTVDQATRQAKARPQPRLEQEPKQENRPAPRPPVKLHPRIAEILTLLIGMPQMVPDAQRLLHPDWFARFEGSELLFRLMESYQHDEWSSATQLMGLLSSEEQNALSALDPEALQALAAPEQVATLQRLAWRSELDYIVSRSQLLQERIRTADENGENDQILREVTELMQKKSGLTKLLSQPF